MLKNYEKLLYSYEDWNMIAKDKIPNYCFEIEKEAQSFFYFGANHSRDLKHPQYDKLRNYWEKFLDKTKDKNSIVLVEGGQRQVHENEELAVRRDSESGFITLLAYREKIPTYSPEPNPLDERKYLLENFSEDKINYYYFARLVNSWNDLPELRSSFQKHIERYSQHKNEMTNWAHYGFPLEKMKKIHQKLFNSEFNENDKEFFALIINPTRKDNPLQKVVIASSTFRNINILKEIKRLWEDGKNIFIVYGSAHAILQEPALRIILK